MINKEALYEICEQYRIKYDLLNDNLTFLIEKAIIMDFENEFNQDFEVGNNKVYGNEFVDEIIIDGMNVGLKNNKMNEYKFYRFNFVMEKDEPGFGFLRKGLFIAPYSKEEAAEIFKDSKPDKLLEIMVDMINNIDLIDNDLKHLIVFTNIVNHDSYYTSVGLYSENEEFSCVKDLMENYKRIGKSALINQEETSKD
ncbi:MAG: hypothetical protein ACYCYI_07360 [Saccharofermentanales bacterium]